VIELALPLPPSVNALWRSARGRVFKSARYKDWIAQADNWFVHAKYRKRGSITGPFTAHIVLDRSRRRGDCDNRVKPVLDILQSWGVIENDKLAEKVSVEWGVAPLGCRVTIEESQ
jgi:Holliday junction resolvase RusA-like endonuclease